MKFTSAILLVFAICLGACNKQGRDQHHHGSGEMAEDGPNQGLYDQVMEVHDEVMPKMNDLYKVKTALSTRLKMPAIADRERDEIKRKIARIDSASEGMMVWMRQFEPAPDSLGQEAARAYLQRELDKVKKVRENILNTLEAVK